MNGYWQRMGGEAQGIALFLLAVLLFSIMDTMAKELSTRQDALQVVWARYTGQTVCAVAILLPRLRQHLATDLMWLQLLRSALLFGATLFFFIALGQLQFAEATAIFQIAPLVITILSVVVLAESVGPRRWFGVLAGLVGALVIIRPGSEVFSVYALFPAIAAVSFAGYSIATRFLGHGESPYTSLLYTTLVGTLVASLALPFFWSPPQGPDWLLMAGMGAVGLVGQLCLILALGQAPASILAPFVYLGLAFNALWGFALFAEVPDGWTVTGAAIIVGAGLYVWHRETRAKAVAVPR
jgi:drug/metabolite transporter (DMT)-like permease